LCFCFPGRELGRVRGVSKGAQFWGGGGGLGGPGGARRFRAAGGVGDRGRTRWPGLAMCSWVRPRRSGRGNRGCGLGSGGRPQDAGGPEGGGRVWGRAVNRGGGGCVGGCRWGSQIKKRGRRTALGWVSENERAGNARWAIRLGPTDQANIFRLCEGPRKKKKRRGHGHNGGGGANIAAEWSRGTRGCGAQRAARGGGPGGRLVTVLWRCFCGEARWALRYEL